MLLKLHCGDRGAMVQRSPAGNAHSQTSAMKSNAYSSTVSSSRHAPQSRDRIYIVAYRKGNKRPNLDYRPVAFALVVGSVIN